MLIAYFCQIKNNKYNTQIELLNAIRCYNELLFNLSYQFDNSSCRNWSLKETHNVVREVMRLVDLKGFYCENYKFNIVDYLKFINSLEFNFGNFYNFDPIDENQFTIEDVKFWKNFRFDDNTLQKVDSAFKQIKDFCYKNISVVETKDEQSVKRSCSDCHEKLRSWTKLTESRESNDLQFTDNEIALIFLAVFYRKISYRKFGDFSNYDLTNVSELIHCYDFNFDLCNDSSLKKLKDVIQMIVCLPDNIKQTIVNFFNKSTKEILDILEKNDIQLFNIRNEKQVKELLTDVHNTSDDENKIIVERINNVFDVNKISVDDFYYAPKTTVEHIDDLFKLIKEKITS